MPTSDEIIKFSTEIDSIVAKTDYSYVEAIVSHCEAIGMELEVAALLISVSLKEKLRDDAIGKHLIKDGGARLPI